MSFRPWEPGEVRFELHEITPVPLHRGDGDHAAQARLVEYLTDFSQRVLPLPDTALPLYLHLHVHVPRETNVLHGYVLETFLAPLFGARWLDGYRFSLVIGTKGLEQPSQLTIGLAHPTSDRLGPPSCAPAPNAAPGSVEWVEGLRRELAAVSPLPLPEGPVHLALGARCSAKRNWVALWKPAIDAMGPILGYDRTGEPHRPRADHLTRVAFHRHTSDEADEVVQLEYRWSGPIR
jgi:hypothetical protein